MGRSKIKEFVLGMVGTIVFLGVVVFTQGEEILCGDSGPGSPPPNDDEVKVFSVTFRNEAPADSIHILGPGEEPSPTANRLAPNQSRTWTTPAPGKKVGDSIIFTAVRSGIFRAGCTGLVSRAVRDENPRGEVVFNVTGGADFLNCF